MLVYIIVTWSPDSRKSRLSGSALRISLIMASMEMHIFSRLNCRWSVGQFLVGLFLFLEIGSYVLCYEVMLLVQPWECWDNMYASPVPSAGMNFSTALPMSDGQISNSTYCKCRIWWTSRQWTYLSLHKIFSFPFASSPQTLYINYLLTFWYY